MNKRACYVTIIVAVCIFADMVLLAKDKGIGSYLKRIKDLTYQVSIGKISQDEFMQQKERLKKSFVQPREIKETFQSRESKKILSDSIYQQKEAKKNIFGYTKEKVISILGKPDHDGGHFWKYGSTACVRFDDSGFVAEVFGIDFLSTEKEKLMADILRGKNFFNHGFYSDSENLFEALLKDFPDYPDVCYFLGLSKNKTKGITAGNVLLKKALMSKPELFSGNEFMAEHLDAEPRELRGKWKDVLERKSQEAAALNYNMTSDSDVSRARTDYNSLNSQGKKAFERDFLLQGIQQSYPGMSREEADSLLRNSPYDPFSR